MATLALTILAMVVSNTEHPPAAGTTLGLVVDGWTASAVIFIIGGALALVVLHHLLKSRMRNLI